MIEQSTLYLCIGRDARATLADGRVLAGRLVLLDGQLIRVGTTGKVRSEDIVDLRVTATLQAYHAAHEAGEALLPEGWVVPFTKDDLEQPERDFPFIRLSNYDCVLTGHLRMERDEHNAYGRLVLQDVRVENAMLSLNCSELRKFFWLYETTGQELLLPAKLQSYSADSAELVDSRGTQVTLTRENIRAILHFPQAGERIQLSDESQTTEGIVLSANETVQDGVAWLASVNLLLEDGSVCTVPVTKATSILWNGKVVASAQTGKSVDLCDSTHLHFDYSTESMAEGTDFEWVRERSMVWCSLSVSRKKTIATEIQQEQERFTGYGIVVFQSAEGIGFIGREFMTKKYAAALHYGSLPRGNVAFRTSLLPEEELKSGALAIVKYTTSMDPDSVPEGEQKPMATKVTVVQRVQTEGYSRFLVDSNGNVSKTVLSPEMVSLSLMSQEWTSTDAGAPGILKLAGAPAQPAQLQSCNLMVNAAVFRLASGETRTLSGRDIQWFRAFGRVSAFYNSYGYVNGVYFHIHDCDKSKIQGLYSLKKDQKLLVSYALAIGWKDREQVLNAVDVAVLAQDVKRARLVMFRPEEAVVELDSAKYDPSASFHLPQREQLMPCDVPLVEDLNFYKQDQSERLTYPVEYWPVEQNGTTMIHLAGAPQRERVVGVPLVGYLLRAGLGLRGRFSFVYRPEQLDWSNQGEVYEEEQKNGIYLSLEEQNISLDFENGVQYVVNYTVHTNAVGRPNAWVRKILWKGRLSDLCPKPKESKIPKPAQETIQEGTVELSGYRSDVPEPGEMFGILTRKVNTSGTICTHYEQGYHPAQLPILYNLKNEVAFTYHSDYNGPTTEPLNTSKFVYLVSCICEGTTTNSRTGADHPTLKNHSEVMVLRRYARKGVMLNVADDTLTVRTALTPRTKDSDRKLLSEVPLPIAGESLLLAPETTKGNAEYRLCTTDGETLFAADDREELGRVEDNLERIWRFGCITDYTAGNKEAVLNGQYCFATSDMEKKLQGIADSRTGWEQLGLLCVFRLDANKRIAAVARARTNRSFLPWEKALVREVIPERNRIVVEALRDQATLCFRNTDNPDDQYISTAMRHDNELKDSTVWVRRAVMCWRNAEDTETQLRAEVFEMRAEEQSVRIRYQYKEDGTGTYVAEYRTSRYPLNEPERFHDYLNGECHIRWELSLENPAELNAELLEKTLQKNPEAKNPYTKAVDHTLEAGSSVYQDRPERKELWEYLTCQTEEGTEFVPGRCAFVWGTRRAGKTTMMNQIKAQVDGDELLRSRTIFIKWGFFLSVVGGKAALVSGKWERYLYEEILRGIADAAENREDLCTFLESNKLSTKLSDSGDAQREFDEFMRRFNQGNTGKRPYRIVLMIDEFTSFACTLYWEFQDARSAGNQERADSLKQKMNFIRYLSEKGIIQIFVGHDAMMQAMEKMDAVNLNVQAAKKIVVTSLPPEGARELIRVPMKRAFGLDPYDSASGQRVVEQMLDLTGCFPDLLIKLCNEMAELYKASGQECLRLQENDLKNVVQHYLEKERMTWNSFSYLTEDDGDNLRPDGGADTSIYLRILAEETVSRKARTIPTKTANEVLFQKMGSQGAAEEAMDKLIRRGILRWTAGNEVKITFGLYLEVAKKMMGCADV